MPKHIILGGLLYYAWQFVFFSVKLHISFLEMNLILEKIKSFETHTHTVCVQAFEMMKCYCRKNAVFLLSVHSEDAC